MKSARVIGLAAATVGALVSCSSDTDPDATTATSETTGAVEDMDRAAVMDRYHADLNAFVAMFRARYPDLAVDRNDASIEHIAIEPCIDLANGVDEQTVLATIAEQAENRGTAPTPEQTQQIYTLVVPVCP
ncbi:conserved hypothetical protein (plasmid) [Rhodococcus jostii RHA1]|jgi:hypothetical protein|uniref:Lipoprotein n=3 Tax=Rhodococcus TaxID=1827 RepID=Q0RZ70_RHOJR|nr:MULTISPECIES: hypothetical protein [Rhodococcus]ABG99416.1 conserved hypothetical protein [Rhodococcus jostii RHA1]EID79575.1 hypothetical protein W59_12956 [Rhodococcus opacus RKJ300 = JCM 13270]PQP20862.1 hypothetical protein C5613_27215 [Rhodococcus opacus]QQZ19132.1 hypothetical protein GO592_37355 [Rhodococcus sp. 21391]